MTVVKPGKLRSRISESDEGMVVTIPSKKSIAVILFMLVWLGGWTMGEFFAIKQVFFSSQPLAANLFLIFWLLGWTVGGCFAWYTVLWQIAGKEIIKLRYDRIVIIKTIFGYGLVKEYLVTNIKNMRVSLPVNAPSSGSQTLGSGKGMIAFDHGAKTIRFGASIDEGEAAILVEKIKQRGYFRN